MKVFIVVLLGITTSILIHGSWLFIDNQTWTSILIDSNFFAYVAKNYHEGWGLALVSSWFSIPVLLPFTVCLAAAFNKLNRQRLFIYTVLSTSAFVFLLLPRLPVFDVLLSGLGSYMNTITHRITPLVLFLLMFYCSSLLIHRHNKTLNSKR